MISAAARPYIDASVPVLREHGVTITRTFYANMFVAHPELTNLFNMGNQASGVQQQSLAAAVFAYAANIDNPGALGPVISRIVQKHVSVGIRAEHYPIVGQYLLGAIQQTLGDAATPPLLAAWEEAYGSLADLFIAAEAEIYKQEAITPGQLRRMRVSAREEQGEQVISLTLQAEDGQPLPDFKPGAYISVSVQLSPTHRQLRQYSLSDAPQQGSYRISIKREDAQSATPKGEISNWLHANAAVGSMLEITHPFGDFAPDTASMAPIVLLSAGIGITPMIAVLNQIARTNPTRQVIFGHAAADQAHHAHRTDLAAATAVMPKLQVAVFYEAVASAATPDADVQQGWMQIERLPSWSLTDATVCLCGPVPFMKAQWTALIAAGVPEHNLHREVFGPELLDFLN